MEEMLAGENIIITHNEAETREIAENFSGQLKAGDIVCLYGDLGCGKTTFSQSAIRSLGVKDQVVSPTFTIVHEYDGKVPVYHFDVYRVHSEEDLFELGYEDYFYGKGICFIEWAELIEELLPENVFRIYFEYTDREDERRIRFEYPGN